MPGDPIRTTLRVAEIFEDLDIPYYVAGSVAGNILGEVRATKDVDFVADLREPLIEPLFAAMKDEFDVSESFLRESIRERRIFSTMYLPEYFKADIFPMRDTPLAREQMNRRIRVLFARDPHRTVSMLTPEDLILSKLDWYRQGHEISDMQWRDIQGVLKIHAGRLDEEYLRRAAESIGLRGLLDKAFRGERGS